MRSNNFFPSGIRLMRYRFEQAVFKDIPLTVEQKIICQLLPAIWKILTIGNKNLSLFQIKNIKASSLMVIYSNSKAWHDSPDTEP